MCWKKKPPVVRPDFTFNTVSSTIVSDYPGTANDLAGCKNDPGLLRDRILRDWDHYVFRPFADNESTVNGFKKELATGVAKVDEETLLLFIMDCCFSESNTRDLPNRFVVNNRFYQNPDLPYSYKIKKKILRPTEKRYLSMSACLDHETAADAVFNARANGAYHYCLAKALKRGITYYQWHLATNAMLKQLGFNQTSTIEGPEDLQNRLVFEGKVICFEISSHGTQVRDRNGDELDGLDEAVYLFDGPVVDDDIQEIISKNAFL